MTILSELIRGVINNGFDTVVLPAVGAYAANDSAASEVGTGDILADGDDDTYITSADGDLGYTVALPPLVGYVEGCTFELHIRMSISGGVNPDDPDNLDADAQVHISTDPEGDHTIGGFSDGVDEGMGFALSVVDGTPVSYVVPLNMSAWVDTTIQDVVDALSAGAYLNVVGVTNNNADITPEVRVYEASVIMIDTTNPSKCLRGFAVTDPGYIIQEVNDDETNQPLELANTVSVDFIIRQRTVDHDPMDDPFLLLLDRTSTEEIIGSPSSLMFTLIDGVPTLKVFDETETPDLELDSIELENNVWYTAHQHWTWSSIETRVFKRSTDVNLIDIQHDTLHVPRLAIRNWCGYINTTSVEYEIMIDNSLLQVNCHEEHSVG